MFDTGEVKMASNVGTPKEFGHFVHKGVHIEQTVLDCGAIGQERGCLAFHEAADRVKREADRLS